jgi:PAS domain S-box-containing protein
LSDIIARTIFNLKVNTRTEKLLRDAQEMTEELQENEEELRQNAEEMRATHEELEKTNANLQSNIREVENAQKRLHSLLENASEIISIYDEDMKLKYISPSVSNIYGYTVEEMMEGKDLDRLTARGVKEFSDMFVSLVETPGASKPSNILTCVKMAKRFLLNQPAEIF